MFNIKKFFYKKIDLIIKFSFKNYFSKIFDPIIKNLEKFNIKLNIYCFDISLELTGSALKMDQKYFF